MKNLALLTILIRFNDGSWQWLTFLGRPVYTYRYKPKFHLARYVSTRHDSTRRHVRCVEPMHFRCVELVEQHGSTRSTRRAQLARRARHDESDSQLSLLCNFYKVIITVIHVLFNVSYSLIYWFHICLIYFIWRNK